MTLQKDYLPVKEGLETLYFGGGTPSLLTSDEIEKLIEKANRVFNLNKGAEITIEGNPDDLSLEKLKALKSVGVNRLSIGVQSFFDKDLKWMNRAHDAKQAVACLENVYKSGFDNFSADLIFGIPGLTDREWQINIEKMLSFDVPHLSCYALTLEQQTPLAHLINKKKIPPLDEEQAARQFKILMQQLAQAGYEQYEISNFAKPGCRSQHNSSYWHHIPYLGIGPGAHSFRPQERQWNISNNARYIKSIQNGKIPCEKEALTPAMQFNEYMMTSLRTMEGCDEQYIKTHFGEKKYEYFQTKCRSFLSSGQLQKRDSRFQLTTKGKLFADGIAAALFL